MAYATCTYTVSPITVMGDKRVHRVKFVVSAYGTDGILFNAAICGLSILDAVIGIVLKTEVANEPVQVVWDETNTALMCHKTANVDTDAATVFNLDVIVMGS